MQFSTKYISFLLSLLAISLPAFPKLVPVFIFILTLLALVKGLREGFVGLKQQPWLWFSVAYYVIYVFGLFYSSNMPEAFILLENKLPFLLIPLIFWVFPPQNFNNSRILEFFTWSNIVCIIILFAHATYLYRQEIQHPEQFTIIVGQYGFKQSYFSTILHPSYFSMYLSLSLCFLLGQIRRKQSIILRVFQILVIALGIYCCDSLMGNAVALIMMALFLLYISPFKTWLYRHSRSFLYLGAIITVILASIMYKPAKNAYQTYYNSIPKTSIESIQARVLVWHECKTLLQQHGITGVGCGDVKDLLVKTYTKQGLTGIAEKQLNAHNQFIQTTLGTGILGLLCLLGLLFYPLWYSFKWKNYLGFCLCLITISNLMVESMFERQAGIVFFVFMLGLIMADDKASPFSLKRDT